MTDLMADDPLSRFTDDALDRPIPGAIVAARADLMAAVRELRTIPDAALTRPWGWKGGSREEVRYGFYRIGEAFELAGIEAAAELQQNGTERGLTADRIAPSTAARWDLQGLLAPLDDQSWDADPGHAEWTIRQTMGHLIGSHRGYAVTTGWWQEQALPADLPELPTVPVSIFDELPTEEAEAEGSPADVRDRLDEVVDRAAERLAGLPADRLAYGARWSGFPVDIGFRVGRWSSHLREHTIQVEKTLVMLAHHPTEVDRLVRHVLAAWGRAELVVFGAADVDAAAAILETAAGGARRTAAEVASLALAEA
jgi:hypothetical protein